MTGHIHIDYDYQLAYNNNGFSIDVNLLYSFMSNTKPDNINNGLLVAGWCAIKQTFLLRLLVFVAKLCGGIRHRRISCSELSLYGSDILSCRSQSIHQQGLCLPLVACLSASRWGSHCCVTRCLRGLGIGVRNSARRRPSMVRWVGCP